MESQPAFPDTEPRRRLWIWLLVTLIVLIGAAVAIVLTWPTKPTLGVATTPSYDKTTAPDFAVETVVNGLDHPWDITFLPDGRAIFTEREGTLSLINGTTRTVFARVDDVKAKGEGGLMGLAVDPEFTANRFVYTCYNAESDVRVVRYRLNDLIDGISEKKAIVTGMPSTPGGRHSGCRLAFGPDGYLWVGTGDAAQGSTPQDPKSLGGKILRVDREGKGVSGNMGVPFDERIYSYGHRNSQGLTFLETPMSGIVGFSAEHGSSVDDEINPLVRGNFGWAPDAAYTEFNIPMTDKNKFPDAVEAIWSSGFPTQAPSGLTQIRGEKWRAWDGALAMAVLKNQHIKILILNDDGKVAKEERIVTDQGRLRDVEQAPDGVVYITTDNGDRKDRIIRLYVK